MRDGGGPLSDADHRATRSLALGARAGPPGGVSSGMSDADRPAARGNPSAGSLVAAGAGFLGLAVWLGALAAGAIAFVPEARLAVRSAAFPAVPGRVVRCDVERRRGDDVPVFSLNLAYAYEVGGDAFVGTRLGAGAIATSDRGWHERAAAALRPGTAVTVFHDPANPAVSLLEPGVTGGHLFLALFLTPFTTLIPAGGLGFVRLIVGDAAGPRDDGDGLRRWDTGGGPAWVAAGRAAVGTALAVTFAGSLGTAFTAGFRPPAWVPAGWFALAALIGGAAANVRYRRRAGGADDVVVDQKRRLLALPIAHGRKARLAVPLDGVAGVESVRTTDAGGDDRCAIAVRLAPDAAAAADVDSVQRLTAEKLRATPSKAQHALMDWLRAELAAHAS